MSMTSSSSEIPELKLELQIAKQTEKNLLAKIKLYERQIHTLKKDQNQLATIRLHAREKATEVEELKTSLQIAKNELKREESKRRDDCNRYEEKIRILQNTCCNLDGKFQKEKSKNADRVAPLKTENQQLSSKNQALIKQLHKLTTENKEMKKDMEQQAAIWREIEEEAMEWDEAHDLIHQCSHFTKRVKYLQDENETLAAEVKRLQELDEDNKRKMENLLLENKTIKDRRTQFSKSNELLAQRNTEIKTLHKELQSKAMELEKQEKETTKQRKLVEHLEKKVQANRTSIATLEKRVQEVTKNLLDKDKEVTILKKEMDHREKAGIIKNAARDDEMKICSENLVMIQAEFSKAMEVIKNLNQNMTDSHKELDMTKAELYNMQSQNFSLCQKLDLLSKQHSELKTKTKQNKDYVNMMEDFKVMTRSLTKLSEENKMLEKELADYKGKVIHQLEDERATQDNKIAEQATEISHLRLRLQRSDWKIDHLRMKRHAPKRHRIVRKKLQKEQTNPLHNLWKFFVVDKPPSGSLRLGLSLRQRLGMGL